jgi:hypothetical protein
MYYVLLATLLLVGPWLLVRALDTGAGAADSEGPHRVEAGGRP